ncbi:MULTISPECIES: tetratricopeptide repeat protein [unclassified Nitrosospira]|jgi:predicted negative regulator of RcsB-dependent stress response|uniref:tetratricopeptide repeat protein n=1 Tax=unclassified Nitrosospira TaxID=2609267 RepID=UPI000D3126EA|nr:MULTISPECIES: tetratricopeptide repeat protein [unclassified Nitrosospira]PTR13938.1 putative negative regulator of RcsB-dependent stress response [Nitrosospira sp. Nsp2]WON72833.1 tetratricopeptide repeat protein [Nitrosospira sp. Is2]
MAVYDLEEQEKIDELKAWWRRYGTLIVIGLAVFAASIAGVQAWKYYQSQKTGQAAELFDSLLQLQTSGDPKKINDAAGLLMEGFPGSGYASRAAIISARASFDARDLQNAKSRLQWVLDNSKEDELKNLARLRLAGILLDEKKYDDALRILETKHGTSFDGLYADLKGDVLSAAGRIPEARVAYQMALDKMGGKGTYFNIVQMKLDALLDAK